MFKAWQDACGISGQMILSFSPHLSGVSLKFKLWDSVIILLLQQKSPLVNGNMCVSGQTPTGSVKKSLNQNWDPLYSRCICIIFGTGLTKFRAPTKSCHVHIWATDMIYTMIVCKVVINVQDPWWIIIVNDCSTTAFACIKGKWMW